MHSTKQGNVGGWFQQGEHENNHLDIERDSQAKSANSERRWDGLVKWIQQERLKDGYSWPSEDKSTLSELGQGLIAGYSKPLGDKSTPNESGERKKSP